MIESARYSTPEHIPLFVIDDGVEYGLGSYPEKGPFDAALTEWLALGNEIAPYNQYYGWPLELAVKTKTDESEAYARTLISEAYGNPLAGITTDPVTYERRVESGRKDRADKQAGEITLDQSEKDQAKSDQKLAEHEGKCWVASDKVIANIAKEDTVNGVMAIDIVTNTTWPVWSAPV